MSDVLLRNAHEIVTCTSADPSCIRSASSLLMVDGCIAAIGDAAELQRMRPQADIVDCSGRILTPGFVDSHTHAVFGDWRAAEFALRSRGVSYMEIARRGGGINASVQDVRARSEDELLALTLPRLELILRGGTTTIEIKSGYGLETASELKQLRVVQRAQQQSALTIVPTFLGAHEFPAEYRDNHNAYVDLLVNEMIPAVAEAKAARFCDVFMEPGVFNAAQARRILEAGASHGLTPKLHADELDNSGAAELAAELHAASADHLGAISDRGINALAHSRTVATLLPATLLFLGKTRYAPARRLIDAGATVALATDFNPGSSPTPSMPLVLTLACSQMGMDPLEAIVAATAGGAKALALQDGTGTLAVGAPADVLLWDVADHREIPYRFGSPPLAALWKRGKQVQWRL
jgi:imidazolonepropionase